MTGSSGALEGAGPVTGVPRIRPRSVTDLGPRDEDTGKSIPHPDFLKGDGRAAAFVVAMATTKAAARSGPSIPGRKATEASRKRDDPGIFVTDRRYPRLLSHRGVT